MTTPETEARAKAFEWDLHERWVSNEGRGPLIARILCVSDGVATMERKHRNGSRWERFDLRVSFLLSDSCGWRRKK